MNLGGISFASMHMYSFLFLGVWWYMFLMSITEKSSFGVDMKLLNSIFYVVNSAVRLLSSSGTSSNFTPIITLTRYGSVF